MALETRKSAQLEDPGAELIDRASSFWAQWGRYVLGGVGAVVILGAGAFFWMRTRENAEEEASRKLAEANVLFWQGDYARSIELARQVGSEHPGTRGALDARRLAGDNAFWSGDFDVAVAEYRAYLDGAGAGMMADAVSRSLAYALESAGKPAEAAPIYERLVGAFDREASAEFLFSAARCHLAAGTPDAAKARLERLLAEFGETSFAPRARLQLAELGAAAR